MTYPQAANQFLAMNVTMEPFQDKKVREAFAYAIDRETLCTELRSGDCLPTLSFIPEGLPGAIDTDQYAFDPEAARQALAESSYGGPDNLPEIKLYFNSDYEERGQQSEWIAGEIRDILGVELTIEPMEGAALTALRKDATTHPQLVYFGSWYQDYPDPQNWLSVFWTCDSSLNPFGYCNEELDELTELGDTTIDPAERLPYYEQAGQILVDDVPAVFLLNPSGIFLVNPAVTGYTPTPSEVEWPGSVSSLMTITKGEAPQAAEPTGAPRPPMPPQLAQEAPVVADEAAAVVGGECARRRRLHQPIRWTRTETGSRMRSSSSSAPIRLISIRTTTVRRMAMSTTSTRPVRAIPTTTAMASSMATRSPMAPTRTTRTASRVLVMLVGADVRGAVRC